MRLVIASLLGILAFSATIVTAQEPVDVQQLARGEVLLELSAMGMTRTAADLAAFTAAVVSTGETRAEASRANQAAVERITEAARSVGVAPHDIRVIDAPMLGTSQTPEFSELVRLRNNLATELGRPASHPVGSLLEFRLRDLNRLSALRQALEEAGATDLSGPNYMLSDQGAALRAARIEAVSAAQADANAFAAAMRMRVIRMVRVTDRVAPYGGSLGQQIRVISGSNRTIETQVVVGVDFILAPQ